MAWVKLFVAAACIGAFVAYVLSLPGVLHA
jgi:hypothetical protein